MKATKGMLWSLADNHGLQAMQLLISALIARLLLPKQFGLIGMLALFMALAQSLLDSGRVLRGWMPALNLFLTIPASIVALVTLTSLNSLYMGPRDEIKEQ